MCKTANCEHLRLLFQKFSTIKQVSFVMFVVTSAALFPLYSEMPSYNLERMYSYTSDEYQNIDLLYAESGIAPPTTAFPVSAREMLMLLKRIKTEKLSDASVQVYETTKQRLDETQKKEITMTAGAEAAVEAYLQTNPGDFGGLAFDDTEKKIQNKYPNTSVQSEYGHRLTNDENLLYGYKDRKAVLNLPMRFTFSPWVYSKVNFRVKTNRVYEAHSSPSVNGMLSCNIPLYDNNVDINFPDEAYIAVDGPFFNVLAGRNKSGWGNGKTGNLLFGNHLDYYDNMRVRLFSDIFSYTFQLTAFDSYFDYAPSSIKTGDPTDEKIPETMSYFVGHRFEARILDRFNFAINEGCMVHSKTFQLQSLSPIFFMHNFYAYGIDNVSLSLELDGYIGKGIGFYAQWCSDQLVADQEIKMMEEKIEPQAWAYMLGLTYNKMFNWGVYSSFLEFVLTDPYMYLEKGQPDQYAYYRAFENGMYNNNRENGIHKIAKPIGYVYGPDAIVVAFGQKFKTGNLQIEPKITYFAAGENNRALNYKLGIDANNQRTPTGSVVEHNIIAEAKINYNINKYFKMYSHTGVIGSINYLNEANRKAFDFQQTIGVIFNWNGTLNFNFPS